MILALLIATLFNTVSSTSAPCTGTTYSVPFPYGATAGAPDLVVSAGGATLAYSSGWTINKVSSTSTGTITLTAACTGTVTITRTTPRTQITDFRTQGKLDLGSMTATLDRIEMQMQESVVANGPATLSSLSLATPLAMANGGTGTNSLNCGAGVVTGDGTSLSCVILSGLAPPGTTGVLLQSTFPGSKQTGNVNITGTLALNITGLTQFSSGAYFQATSPGLKIYPADFNTNLTGSRQGQYSFYGPQGPSELLKISWANSTIPSGATTLGLSGCTTSWPCVSVNSGGNTALFLAGSGAATNNKVVTTTNSINVTSGNLFEVTNNALLKASVDFAGALTATGVTSSGPVSGTTGSFTGAMSGTTGSFTGGVTIGTSGTAISGSYRGTTVWNPGTLPACGAGPCALAFTNVTVTNAVTGADCVAGVTSPAPSSGYPVACIVTAASTCQISIVNQANVGVVFGSATFYCRVFNP